MIDPGIERKLAALQIIFTAPLWPQREALSPAGQRLFDRLIEDAKPYAPLVVDGDFSAALTVAAAWAPLVDALIDSERIEGNDAAQRLLGVFAHYCNAIADFGQIVVSPRRNEARPALDGREWDEVPP